MGSSVGYVAHGDPSKDAGGVAFRVRWEPLSCLGSGHHHGHVTVVFARRPYGYFNVLAESGEEGLRGHPC
jgi:hypothetical protein